MSLVWQIEYSYEAGKSLSKIDRAKEKLIRRRISDRLASLENPVTHPQVTAMVGSQSLYRYRIGEYRAVFTVKKSRLVILVVNVAHRSKVYAHRSIKKVERQSMYFGLGDD